MRRFAIALAILLAYMAVDAGLTTIGLDLGLRESNTHAMRGLAPHALLVILALSAFAIERYLNLKYIVHTAILLLNGFYIFVLIHNLHTMWRYA